MMERGVRVKAWMAWADRGERAGQENVRKGVGEISDRMGLPVMELGRVRGVEGEDARW